MQTSFFIGKIPIHGTVVHAPMDGISDSPYRQICREAGSAFSISEFINALNFVNGHPHIHEQFPFHPTERPFAYQIFDSDVNRILKTAHHLLRFQPDMIDINMGCSNRAVSGRGAGAGLMREPEKVKKLFNQLTKEIPVPVTAKIRLGWDEHEINYLEIAKLLQDSGCACITLHARTRAQQYGGQADWDAIATLVQHVSIPVIGNGDVQSPAQIDQMLQHTQCAAVMIGRGAIGNPWLFARSSGEQIPPRERLPLVLHHLQLMENYYGADRGVVLFRKFLKPYLRFSQTPLSEIRNAYQIMSHKQLAQKLQELVLA